MNERSLHLVSDFNSELFASTLDTALGPGRTVTRASFSQVFQTLRDPKHAGVPDQATLVVWTRPEAVIEGFRRALGLERVDHMAVLEETERYAQLVLSAAASVRYLLHPTWTIAASKRLFGTLDLKPGLGVRSLLARMNDRLTELMTASNNVFVLDAGPWFQAAGPKAHAPKLEFITKVPFPPAVFVAAAKDIRAALDSLDGRARKVVVLDLDNTLWGGVVGDDGPNNLRLGGHDHLGEAYAAFQRSLLALSNRGVQLAILSKNDEALALSVIETHPEMVLRREHFAGWRINWNDKAANLAALAEDLRLGMQSFVFIDDNPVERSRISTAFPEVLVPDWPADPALYASTLDALDCFDVAHITEEDFERTASQDAERRRRASQSANPEGGFGDWLESLETRLQVEPLSPENLSRVTQLFNKTNQLNLTTRRLSAGEIQNWVEGADRQMWAVRVRDRFGDSGLTGVVSVELRGPIAHVTDLILSCRVMGRGVEQALLHLASAFAKSRCARELHVSYQPTARNGPCLKVLEESGLSKRADTLFIWDKPSAYELPRGIQIER